MDVKRFLANLDQVTKLYASVILVLVAYLVSTLVFASIFNHPFNRTLMNFSAGDYFLANFFALLTALFTGFAFSVLTSNALAKTVIAARLQAASKDEQAVLRAMQSAGPLTQDSLRFRLEWSKAKTSQIVSQLDKKGLLVRERTGKTYALYLPKAFSELVLQRKNGFEANPQ